MERESVQDQTMKRKSPVEKFLFGTQEIRFDELDHAVVLYEVVLQRCSGQRYPASRIDGGYYLGDSRRFVFQQMTLVTDDQIGT